MDQHTIQLAQATATSLVDSLDRANRQWQQDGHADRFRTAVHGALDEAMNRLAASDLWGPANRMASNEFWRIAQTWLCHGDLQLHARTKPRGYAGDFELLRKISLGICCEHPLGHIMDRYFQNEAAPCAVRRRTELVAQRLVQRCQTSWPHPLRIVSVGSGPAIELQQVATQLPPIERQRLRITLLDIDQQALDYASSQLASLLDPAGVTAIRANLARLPDNSKVADSMFSADYLFCPGFFDYLEQDTAVEMLNLFYRSLAPGGELTVFNFSPSNTSRAYMEWIGNWYLNYRDLVAMRQLGEGLGVPDSPNVRGISDGTLVELTLRRPGPFDA